MRIIFLRVKLWILNPLLWWSSAVFIELVLLYLTKIYQFNIPGPHITAFGGVKENLIYRIVWHTLNRKNYWYEIDLGPFGHKYWFRRTRGKDREKNEKKKDQILITSKHGMQFKNYMLTHVVANLHNTHSSLVSIIIQ